MLSCVQFFCDTMDFSPPGSSVHGILQARILEWVAFCFSRGSSQPRDQTQVSHTAGGFFTVWATWGSLRKLKWVAFPFSRDLPDPGIEPRSPALQVDSLSSVSASSLNVRTNSGHPSYIFFTTFVFFIIKMLSYIYHNHGLCFQDFSSVKVLKTWTRTHVKTYFSFLMINSFSTEWSHENGYQYSGSAG